MELPKIVKNGMISPSIFIGSAGEIFPPELIIGALGIAS